MKEIVKVKQELVECKSESKAKILALTIPSAGHIYAENWWPKGTLFLAGEIGLLVGGLSQEETNTRNILFTILGAVKIWEMYDVTNDIKDYNKKVNNYNEEVVKFNQYIKKNSQDN